MSDYAKLAGQLIEVGEYWTIKAAVALLQLQRERDDAVLAMTAERGVNMVLMKERLIAREALGFFAGATKKWMKPYTNVHRVARQALLEMDKIVRDT